MPVLSVVIPRLKTNQLSWTFSGAFEVLLLYNMICIIDLIWQTSTLKEGLIASKTKNFGHYSFFHEL